MSRKDKSCFRYSADYNRSLIQRGSFCLWLDEEVVKTWQNPTPTGKCGTPRLYSDSAIQCATQIRSVFNLPLRATQGCLESLFKMLKLDLKVLNYTTISRRLGKLNISILKRSKKPVRHLVIDSTGLKVFGEGEWKVRVLGYSKRQTWRKLHLGIDVESQEIVCSAISTNDFKDNELFTEFLFQLPADTLKTVAADGAYDARNCYAYCSKHKIKPLIPPQRNAKLKKTWKLIIATFGPR